MLRDLGNAAFKKGGLIDSEMKQLLHRPLMEKKSHACLDVKIACLHLCAGMHEFL